MLALDEGVGDWMKLLLPLDFLPNDNFESIEPPFETVEAESKLEPTQLVVG
jgi:hypothetical protein